MKVEIKLSEGMLFQREVVNSVYLLSEVDKCKYCLINLETGSRWEDAGSLDEIALELNKGHFQYFGHIKNMHFYEEEKEEFEYEYTC